LRGMRTLLTFLEVEGLGMFAGAKLLNSQGNESTT